jgi:hypothetical protein
VLVAYLGFRTYDWRVYSRLSSDRGGSFGPEQSLTDAAYPPGDNNEALDATPRAGLGAGTQRVAFTDFRKRIESQSRPHQLYDIDIASPGGADHQVDPHGSEQISTFSPALVTLPDGDALVAWQDHAGALAQIELARVHGLDAAQAWRVEDSGGEGANGWRPALALTRGEPAASVRCTGRHDHRRGRRARARCRRRHRRGTRADQARPRAHRHRLRHPGRRPAGGADELSVLAAWEDERNGPAQIYVARAPVSKLR